MRVDQEDPWPTQYLGSVEIHEGYDPNTCGPVSLPRSCLAIVFLILLWLYQRMLPFGHLFLLENVSTLCHRRSWLIYQYGLTMKGLIVKQFSTVYGHWWVCLLNGTCVCFTIFCFPWASIHPATRVLSSGMSRSHKAAPTVTSPDMGLRADSARWSSWVLKKSMMVWVLFASQAEWRCIFIYICSIIYIYILMCVC